MTLWSAIDPRIFQAGIAACVVMLGWLFNGWRNRREATRLRRERLSDVHRALYAEIGSSLANFGSIEAIREGGARILGRMEEDDSYHPFIARLDRAIIFESVVSDIHILPRTSIDSVVAFYGQLSAIDALTDDMRSETVKGLSKDRRMAIYADYSELRKQAFLFGNHALKMIDAYAQGGKEYARQIEAETSSLRSVDRSDP